MSEVAIKEGYKETKIGWIPEEWDYKKIGNDIELLSGFAFKSSEYSDEGIRLLRCANVKRGVTDWSEGITKFWESLTPKLERYVMKEGDLVIAMDGSLVGRSFALISKNDLPCLLLQRVARIRSNKISIPFLKEWIGSNFFVKYCDSVKTVTAIPHISSGDIKKFQIPLPPLPEQKKIAQILTTWDTAIEKTEHLLQQLQLRKKGLMQQLLSGKKRLKGFEGEWEENKLAQVIAEMTDYVAAGSFASLRENVSVYEKPDFAIYVRLVDLRKGLGHEAQKFVDKNSYEFLSKSNLFGNEILVANIGANVGETFLMPTINTPATIAPNMIVIRTNNEILGFKYLYYFLQSPFGQKRLQRLIAGSGHPKINKTELKTYKILIPSIKEQTAIANILTQSDLEIQKTKNYLTQLQAQKQGLMQQLLTGQKRVKIN